MKAEGLEEGSGVSGTDLTSYEPNEVWDLIQITRCFPELQAKQTSKQSKLITKKNLLIAWLLIGIALAIGIVFYYKQYPSSESRQEISVDGVFFD